MFDVNSIKKFASDACQVIEACQECIGELKAENEQLKAMNKQASVKVVEKAIAFDEDLLHKTASAVHALYGSPAHISPETLADAWKSKPELMLSAINKFASELASRAAVRGESLGESVSKKASAPQSQNADDALRSKYGSR